MGPHVQCGNAHQRGETNSRTLVVGEHEEGARERAGRGGEHDAVDDGCGSLLTNTEVQHATVGVRGPVFGAVRCRVEGLCTLDGGQVRAGEVSGATPQFGEGVSNSVDDGAGCRAGCHGGASLEHGEGSLVVCGQFACDEALVQFGALGVSLSPRLELLVPCLVCRCAALNELAGVRQDVLLDEEALGGVEAEQFLGCGNLFSTELGAVHCAGVLLGGGGVADDGAQLNEGGLVGDSLCTLNSGVQFCDILNVVAGAGPVHALNIPTVGLVALCYVLGEGNVGVFLNGDVVAVPDDDQVAELLVARKRAGFGGHALLHVTFGGDDVDVVVEGGGARCCFGVEHAAHTTLCVGETNGGGQALAERAGGDFYALGVLVFGVAGGEGTPGAQGFQVAHFEAVAAEEQLSVQGEGGVAGGEDEAVTAFPAVVGGILVHDLLEEQVGDRRQAHCGAGVAGSDLFYGVCGEDTCGIYGALVGFCPLEVLCHVGVLSQREWMRQQACASALSVGCNVPSVALIPAPVGTRVGAGHTGCCARGVRRVVSTLSF